MVQPICGHHQAYTLYKISGFRRKVDENWTVLGYYAASSGNFVSMFQDNLSVSSSSVKNPETIVRFVKVAPIGSPEMLIRNCRCPLCNNLEEGSFKECT